MFFPSYSGRFASSVAPQRAAPLEFPTKTPSDFATIRAASKEGFTVDLDARKIELEKQLNDSIRKLNECTKELHDIKNSKLYHYMVNLRSIKHKFTD